jgi:hypothetical protein
VNAPVNQQVFVSHDDDGDVDLGRPVAVELHPDVDFIANEAVPSVREALVLAFMETLVMRVGECHVEVRVDRVPWVAHHQDRLLDIERLPAHALRKMRLHEPHRLVNDTLYIWYKKLK